MSNWEINSINDLKVVTVDTSTIPTAPSTTGDSNVEAKSWLTIICSTILVLLVCVVIIVLVVVILNINTTQTTSVTTAVTTAATTVVTTMATTVVTTMATTTSGVTTLPSISSTTTICSNNPTTTASTTVAPGSPVTSWYMSNPCSASSSYFQVSFYYYAQSSNETLTFGIINAPAYTYLDDVSVLDLTQSSTELLCNGGFENGTCICWSGTCPISTSPCRTGSYCINNGYTYMTYMSQTFNTNVGDLLYISFYTYWTGSGSGVTTSVSMTP